MSERAPGPQPDDPTVTVSVLINLMKHARGRCRSNAALYNYLNRIFSPFKFKEVPIEGKPYGRLVIIPPVGEYLPLEEGDES